jgi:hypothetical protein
MPTKKGDTLQSELKNKGAGKQIINFVDSVLFDTNTDEPTKKQIIRLVIASLDAENELKAKQLLGRIK